MSVRTLEGASDWRRRYQNRFYPADRGWIDGTTEFFSLIASVAQTQAPILEVGAGPTNGTTSYLATLGEVHGVDVDEAVLANAALASAHVIRASTYPFGEDTFALCVSNYVVEHLKDGEAHLREVHRVLRRGGAYVFRTVNKRHYVALIAAATPHWFHRFVANRARHLPSSAHDPYPTVYALNTAGEIRRAANAAGLVVERLQLVEKEPVYGRFSRLAFLLGTAYERLVNAHSLLAPMRANLFVVLRKPDSP